VIPVSGWLTGAAEPIRMLSAPNVNVAVRSLEVQARGAWADPVVAPTAAEMSAVFTDKLYTDLPVIFGVLAVIIMLLFAWAVLTKRFKRRAG